MRLFRQLLTRNDCYREGGEHIPRGVMVHSTGANNPRLSRYVAPDDGRLGAPSPQNWNRPDLPACVHAFIGRLADGSVATYQTLPWTMPGWHSGTGSLGYARNANHSGYIGFEICEDGLTDPAYFAAVYREAVELTAYLCREFCLDPEKPGVVICHSEGHRLGIASNHADVMHWFPRFGKSMDTFRADVARLLAGPEEETYSRFKACMARYLKELTEQPADPWAAGLLEEAKGRGLTDGARPRSFCTRQEAIVLALKAAKE